ncbi:MAG: PQQ-binding-like beta-propeller repeat protein, partial [bacterium]
MKQKTVLNVFITILFFTLLTIGAYQASAFAPRNVQPVKASPVNYGSFWSSAPPAKEWTKTYGGYAGESLEVDWWPMFRHDQSHTGYSISKAPDNNSTLWIYDTKSGIFSSPAVFEEVVFIGSGEYLYALNATTGILIWKYRTGTISSSPAIANRKVFVGSYDGNVYALNATSGQRIWNYSTREENWPPAVQSSAVVANGRVFIGSGRGKMYALDENTGAKIWSFQAEVGLFSSSAVANDMVYFGSRDHKVYALNASTGVLIWRYTTGDEIYSSPCVAEGKVFIGSNDGKLYALDASTGTPLWSFAALPSGVNGVVRSSPAYADGSVFVGSFPGFLSDNRYGAIFALNASTGALIWKYTTGTISYSSPAVADGKVFVMNFYNGTIYALNATTGALVWSYNTEGTYSESSPAVADGKVFVGSANGKVYSFGRMLYFNITVDPRFYDNRGEPLVPSPSSWTIIFPNGTGKAVSGSVTFNGPMGTYSIGNVIWKGIPISIRSYPSIFIASNITWSPQIDCILPTDLSISLSSSTSYIAFKVEIRGNLTSNEIGVTEASILLSYSVTGGQSWNDITLVNTSADGSYFAIWMPPATGNYLVRASWTG